MASQPRKAGRERQRGEEAHASMGPWLRSHGRDLRLLGLAHRKPRFNGAVASQPRKGMDEVLGRPLRRCFNGAVASQPRKVGRPSRPTPTPPSFNGAVASQPRKAHPENKERHDDDRFNGAVASQPRKAVSRAALALAHAASMGPWLRSHGRALWILEHVRWEWASMGPWLRSHGR